MTRLAYSQSNSLKYAHVDGYRYNIKLIRRILMSIGTWPILEGSFAKIISIALVVFFFSSLVITFVPCILNTLLADEDLNIKLESIGPVLYWAVSLFKYGFLLMHDEEIRDFMGQLETDWQLTNRIQDRTVMFKYLELGRYVTIVCLIFMHTGPFSYGILKVLSPIVMTVGNVSVSMYPMPCPCYEKLLDTRYSPTFEIIITIQCISLYAANTVAIGTCSLPALLVMHACGQIETIVLQLHDLVQDNDLSKHTLGNIVEKHVRVLSFATRIEKMIHKICFLDLLGSTLNICMLGYYCITELENNDAKRMISYGIILISMLFNIYIFCYISEKLTDQCGQIGKAAYACNWYRLPKQTILGLVIIIMRSSSVFKLTAGKIVCLSFATFGDVVKTTMVYINLLRQMAT
ncbi:hypothetical protein KPH14_009211 [Odynerus spinipes]|uniref:Odorant receptor n=1 Tax=Odynerus spinipes TaxID=1348599 RepID=A0AAD9RPY8_9HYME|nr:hypothetical protein KPH14_009211 [Odynerus spinipes]